MEEEENQTSQHAQRLFIIIETQCAQYMLDITKRIKCMHVKLDETASK